MVTLSRLFIHPVKSMRGMGLTHAFADISGLAFDRLFMVTETDGTFITARQFPQMVKFIPAPLHDGLHLTAPDGSSAVEMQDPKLHCVISQYADGWKNVREYPYSAYTDELGAAHGNFTLTREYIESVLYGSIDEQFVTLD